MHTHHTHGYTHKNKSLTHSTNQQTNQSIDNVISKRTGTWPSDLFLLPTLSMKTDPGNL